MEFTPNRPSTKFKSLGIKKWLFFSVLLHAFFMVYILPHVKNRVQKHTADAEPAEKLMLEKVRFEQKKAGALRYKIERMQAIRDDLVRVRNQRIKQLRAQEAEMRRQFPEKYAEYKKKLKEVQDESGRHGRNAIQALKKMQKLQQEIAGLLEAKEYRLAVEKAGLLAQKAEEAAVAQNQLLRSLDYYDAKLRDFEELMAWLQNEVISGNIHLQLEALQRNRDAMQEHFAFLDQLDIYMRKRVKKSAKDLDLWQRSGGKSFWSKRRMEKRLEQIAKKDGGGERLEEAIKQTQIIDRRISESMTGAESARQKNGIPGAQFNRQQTGGERNIKDVPVSQLLQAAKSLQVETAGIYKEARAAELAVSQHMAYQSAYGDIPDMEEALSATGPVDMPENPASMADLNDWKTSFNATTRDLDRILAAINAMRKKAMESQTSVSGEGLQNVPVYTRRPNLARTRLDDLAGPNGGRVRDLSSYMRAINYNTPPPAEKDGRKLPPDLKIWENHYGRKLNRHGKPVKWFYIHSWYIIGPFPNEKRRNVEKSFPPESIVDLDANYTGKYGRTVSWEFLSSSSFMIVPPHYDQYAIYYAYTELYVEQPMDLWIAVGSDDRSDVWINDIKVWQSVNQVKQWRLTEGLRRVHFKKGHNKILLRLENSWRECGFSVLVCAGPERTGNNE